MSENQRSDAAENVESNDDETITSDFELSPISSAETVKRSAPPFFLNEQKIETTEFSAGVMVTSTVARPPAGTVTLAELNVAVALEVLNDGVNVFAPVERAATCDKAYVVAVAALFSTVKVRVAAPVSLSPSDNLPGLTPPVAIIARSIATMPAPWR